MIFREHQYRQLPLKLSIKAGDFADFDLIRNKYLHVDTIKQLFNDAPIDNVFLFLKY